MWFTIHIFVTFTCVFYSVKHLDTTASIDFHVLSSLWGTFKKKTPNFLKYAAAFTDHVSTSSSLTVKHLPAVPCGHQQWLCWLT